MEPLTTAAHIVRFGVFELDAASGELRRHGVKVHLTDQPLQILRLLLEHPGVVTRQALRERLWSADTFVDFDTGLNSAIRKLREALDDSADNPRFIETLPRRGYRFIAPHQPVASPAPRAATVQLTAPKPASKRRIFEAAQTGMLRPAARVARAVVGVLVAIQALDLMYQATASAWPSVASPGMPIKPLAVLPYETQAGSWSPDYPAFTTGPRPGVPPNVSPEAYDLSLKALYAARRQTQEGMTTAAAYLEQAIAIQPDFAAAYASLAQLRLQFGGSLPPRDVMPRAEEAARAALRYDPNLAQAHATLGQILHVYYWRWEDGDRELARARELGAAPGMWFALSLIRKGRTSEAIEELDNARSLDPLSPGPWISLAIAYRAAGRYDEAITTLRHAIDMDRMATIAGHYQLGITYMGMDRMNDAIYQFELSIPAGLRTDRRVFTYLGYGYVIAGRSDKARSLLSELEALRTQQYVSSYGVALIHDALGDREAAMTALRRAYDEHAIDFAQTAYYPPFKTIATDPRYEDLLRRVGLPPPAR